MIILCLDFLKDNFVLPPTTRLSVVMVQGPSLEPGFFGGLRLNILRMFKASSKIRLDYYLEGPRKLKSKSRLELGFFRSLI